MRDNTKLLVFALLIALLSFARTGVAQTDEGLLLNPWDGKDELLETQADGFFMPESHMDHHNGLLFAESQASGRIRLTNSLPINPSVGFQFEGLFPADKQHLLPRQLTDMSVGFASPLAKVGDYFVAAGGAIGYAGEAPFRIPSGFYGKGQFMVGRQFANQDVLLFVLDYDGNRTFLPDVPLPAFEYKSKYNKDIDYVIGAPESSIEWRITPDWTFSTQFYIPDSFDISLTYKLTQTFSIYSEYSEHVSAFHTRNLGSDGRLFYEEQRAELGLRWKPAKHASFIVAGGYAFGRDFSYGFDVRQTTVLSNVGDAPYVRAGLQIGF